MENIRRTLYGAGLQTALVLRIPYDIKPYTTLNEKFGSNASETLATGEMPRMGYISIGNGGHTASVGADGISLIGHLQHKASDPTNFKNLPFSLRPLDDDLADIERERYGMRVIETHGGVEYAAYYLKRLDMNGVSIAYKKKTVVAGVETISDFEATAATLNPVPDPLLSGNIHTTDGEYVYSTAVIEVIIDDFDAAEILNAAVVLYGREDYAFVSEIAFVSGVDRVVPSMGAAGATFNMNEVIAAQVFCHTSALQPLMYQRDGFIATYDVGIAEPMLNLATP